MSSRVDPQSLGQVLKAVGYARVNHWIRFGCLGVTTSVFVAWQYAYRDGGTLLADSEAWGWLDVRLPARALERTRRFLDENFYLRPGNERKSPWTIITNAFSHRTFSHFMANTLAFNTFCNILEPILPPLHFVGLILTTGVAGSAAFLFQQSQRKFPNRRIRALGMSGITTGIGIATAVVAPNLSVAVMGYPMPIWVALGGYVASDAFFLGSENSNTGHAAHLGGAFAGLLYAVALRAQGVQYDPMVMFMHGFVRSDLSRRLSRSRYA